MPRLGAKYQIEIDITSKPKDDYQTDEYDDIVVEGSGVSEHEVEVCICRKLRLPEPNPPQKGILSCLFNTD